MGLSINKIKKAANQTVDKVKEASEALEKAAREEAERASRVAAEEAEKIRIEAKEAARKELEEAARKAAEAAKEAEKAIKEKAEEEAKKAIEEAKKQAELLKNQAESFAREQINNSVNSLVSEMQNFTSEGQKFVQQIQEQMQNLIDLANIEALKRKLLDQAEQLSEEYLTTKIQPISEQIHLIAVPDIKLDLNNVEIKMNLYIYFLLQDDKDKSPSEYAIGILTTDLVQSITKLEAPDVYVQFDFNKDRMQDMVKERIQSEKNQLIKAFLMSFFSDYVAVFDVLIRYLPK